MSSGAGATVVCTDARAAEDVPELDLPRWERLAQAVLDAHRAAGELTLTFVDRAEMASLNAQHMGVDGPTDVLSFPLEDEALPGVPTLLGDVVISPTVAAAQAADHAGNSDDEIALLVVHGVLHVLGHDHADPDEAVVMRARELELLEEFHWVGAAPSGFRHTHAD